MLPRWALHLNGLKVGDSILFFATIVTTPCGRDSLRVCQLGGWLLPPGRIQIVTQVRCLLDRWDRLAILIRRDFVVGHPK